MIVNAFPTQRCKSSPPFGAWVFFATSSQYFGFHSQACSSTAVMPNATNAMPSHMLSVVLMLSSPVRGRGSKPAADVVGYARCVRHARDGRIHRARRREHAAVSDVEVVGLVGAADGVEHGRLRIVAEANRAALVAHAADAEPLVEKLRRA